MKKTIIYLARKHESGKTHSINRLYFLLTGERMPNEDLDFEKEVLYRGVRIGLSSSGDDIPCINKIIPFIISECPIIVCASLTWGQTIDRINKLANDKVLTNGKTYTTKCISAIRSDSEDEYNKNWDENAKVLKQNIDDIIDNK